MLKKTGIVVATAAAGLLALSPLAYAGDCWHHGHHSSHHGGHGHGHGGKGGDCSIDNSVDNGRGHGHGSLLDISNTNISVPVQACNNSVIEGVLGVLAKDQRNSDSH